MAQGPAPDYQRDSYYAPHIAVCRSCRRHGLWLQNYAREQGVTVSSQYLAIFSYGVLMLGT